MASSMAAAAAHSMPPFPLPALPRVRPPPIPKGTPGPNTRPQPGPPPKTGLVWVDGRWANPRSQSAKHKQVVVSKQLEKALQHEVHGMNIYAYKHIRTHQVVYSLTNSMDNSKILKQLLFHGKKTVPAALRRDLWRPYFSVHFPRTPAGALKGLNVFQELRELSFLRQMSPPRDMTIATLKDLDEMKKSYSPNEWTDKTENEIKGKKLMAIPVLGEKLPARMLARRLMNQAATSVADVAAVLARQINPSGIQPPKPKKGQKPKPFLGPTPQQQMNRVIENRQTREEAMTVRAHNRLSQIRKEEGSKAAQIEERQQYLDTKPGMVKIDRHAVDRINIEYEGVGNKLAMITEADQATQAEIGAREALRNALEDLEEEKRIQRDTIEREMGAQIEQRLHRMTDAERSQISQEVEAERAQKQSDIDLKITTIREEVRLLREGLHKQPASSARTRAIRKLTREGHAKVSAMKTELRNRHLKWVGPFAAIAAEVDKAMAKLDTDREPRLSQLRAEAESEKQMHADAANHEVEVRWANIRDGTYAKSWPESVFHTELQPIAVSKAQGRTVTTHYHLDADEERIETQYGTAEVPIRSSVHVFGSVAPDGAGTSTTSTGRYQSPNEMSAQQMETRSARVQEWANTEAILLRDRILSLRAEVRDLETKFTNVALDRDSCPYIAVSLECIEQAQSILEEMDRRFYKATELGDIDAQINYVREIRPYSVAEIPRSKDIDAANARVRYVQLSADLIALESRNLEAYHQANMRETFYSKFNEREKLEDAIERFKQDRTLHATAVREMRNFDFQYPFIADAYSRREALYDTLKTEIEDGKSEIERLEVEIKSNRNNKMTTTDSELDPASNPRTQLRSEVETLRARTMEFNKLVQENEAGKDEIRKLVREDRKAWIEFKNAGGLGAYDGGLGKVGPREARTQEVAQRQAEESKGAGEQSRGGMVMGEPESEKGLWARMKDKMSGRRRKRTD